MEAAANYGWLALLPPLVAIILCFITKRVLISLFLGIFVGGLIISGYNPIMGVGYTLDTIVAQLGDSWNANLLIFNLLMGAGIAFIWKLNGSKALTDWARTRIKTKRGAGVGAWLLGVLVFFNDYCNAAIVGNTFRDISEEHKMSSEKLSFILDATAAPVATFFISDWIAFQIGMLNSGLDAAGLSGEMTPLVAYFKSIPMNIYCILTVLFVGVVVISQRDFGPMKKAEMRAEKEGKIIRDGGKSMLNVDSDLGKPMETAKPRLITFFLPIIVLVAVTLIGFYYTGLNEDTAGGKLIDILGAADAAKALLWGAFGMTFTGLILALGTRSMKLSEAMDAIIDGMKLMLLACVILVLAWSMGGITGEMNLAGFIVGLFGEGFPFALLPAVIFILGMGVAFATGTSWGTMTILTPIAIPLAYNITKDANLSVMMAGVVFSGAIFGDHCSPISDTTVLASIFAGADHIDHTLTQIPYALLVASVAMVSYLVYGITRISPFIILPIALVGLIAIFYAISSGKEKLKA